jgi:quercetin dioxygenase-like cupin family protein
MKEVTTVNRLILILVAMLALGAPLSMAQKQGTETLRPKERFQLKATLTDKAGKPKTVNLSARQWDVLGNQRLAVFPEHGFLLVQLVGGRVTTIIAGKEQKRRHGEFWTVPANTQMSVTAVGEDATLQVVNFTIP